MVISGYFADAIDGAVLSSGPGCPPAAVSQLPPSTPVDSASVVNLH
ncbi:hypothetical protein Caci_7211 [Catenulispora acidiphila DSM 44928]|uniref:Uncharacterized protein n=1 Tax=Catenulispora acidiphila (strain DSM 44928 / JCM 14897 / NBRC 102108 / NRRL B-24433 / ID139908) TaxID=479433 RepID=C7Q727_CATAD|nr:hypothetical protein Caci_7211 [Catenulispora acidiphila DSM 44928]